MNTNETKTFSIEVTSDNKYLQIHCPDMPLATPCMPFVTGSDFLSMQSNVPNILKHIKDMMRVEGYNHVICIESDLAIYHEILHELKTIPELSVVYE